MRPSGRPMTTSIDRPDEIATLATELIAKGCKLEVEVLRTGEVSFEVIAKELDDEGAPQTLAMQITPNGPAVLTAVDTLIKEAHERINQ
jgi:hypothetical protein